VGALSFALTRFGAPATVQADNRGDNVALGFCLQGSMEAEIDGHKFGFVAGQGVITRPNKHIELKLSEDCIRLIARVHPRMINSSWDPGSISVVDLQDQSFRPFWQIAQTLFGSSAIMAAVHNNEQVALNMERLLISLLNELKLGRQHRASTGGAIMSRDVRRAHHFIHDNATEEIDLPKIAEACGVSPRTLQSNFSRFCDYTPMEYLKNHRLSQVRKLLSSPFFKGTVSEAALDNGIAHLGRFAKQYRERYGESPSVTLRLGRHRAQGGVPKAVASS
jgi:AraC-like DNA-binding protein